MLSFSLADGMSFGVLDIFFILLQSAHTQTALSRIGHSRGGWTHYSNQPFYFGKSIYKVSSYVGSIGKADNWNYRISKQLMKNKGKFEIVANFHLG